MIQQLSANYSRFIAFIFLQLFFHCTLSFNSHAAVPVYNSYHFNSLYTKAESRVPKNKFMLPAQKKMFPALEQKMVDRVDGGPVQPEMSSFKSIGTDNMVNLFTGDFSYNIPLMDVGGYALNMFYDGSVGPEQEASWVGLGWNINPGNINRNMRGVPDDFNGTDELIQTQDLKENITWGANAGTDFEFSGVKIPVGVSLGVSVNNYLGPALELGVSSSIKVPLKTSSEKSALGINGALDLTISSRNGVSVSPAISLTAYNFKQIQGLSVGPRLATSYNSRTGIRALQISEQVSFSKSEEMKWKGEDIINTQSVGGNLVGTSISFAKPSYIPSIRIPMENEAFAGRFQVGSGIFGAHAAPLSLEVYKQTSRVAIREQKKPLVGYLYYQNANDNPQAVLDFTRVNDNEVTPNTPILSAPQYTYDVFSIQGEGTGGSIRLYRNDNGYIRDNYTRSQDKSLSVGGDVGVPGHYGGNFSQIKTPTVIGEWGTGNKLKQTSTFGFRAAQEKFENVYFRNPGETSVINPQQYENIGGTDLVRFRLGGTNSTPSIDPILDRFSPDYKPLSYIIVPNAPAVTERKKRTQVTQFLTAAEAALAGLDKKLRNYRTDVVLNPDNSLNYLTIERQSEYRKPHHISEINVIETDGKRYVYGLPVYNIVQRDFTFSVSNAGDANDRVVATPADTVSVKTDRSIDGFLQKTTTPAFANGFLLTGLLSPDYIDVEGDGITEDDLGTAVKFNYTRVTDHKWQTPSNNGGTVMANFNAGLLSERKDDKGLVSYGERESWYVHSIESKTMIALFTLESRSDGKGVLGPLKGRNNSDNSTRRLKKIDLYSKADLKKNGLTGAKPIKTVWFVYSYRLCPGTPDNTVAQGGKLTLDGIYFTFNGVERATKNKYTFNYGTSTDDNPAYAMNAADRWGNYKKRSDNPNSMKNGDYPYVIQNKTIADKNAGAWALKKILLPSGGQIEVDYESDDYAYVQDRKAMVMMKIEGIGKSQTEFSSNLYTRSPGAVTEHDYVKIKVPDAGNTREEIYDRYLKGVTQLAFKLAVKMPKGTEYIPTYATIADYGKIDNTNIWVKLNRVDNYGALSHSALIFLREQLPGQAFIGYDVSEGSTLQQIGYMCVGMLDGLHGIFQDPIQFFRSENKAREVDLNQSFVRLNVADGIKYGGGSRVKRIRIKDNWNRMKSSYLSEYGQEYSYVTTDQTINGAKTISSGVASYEPSIGGEENPFQTIIQIANKLPLGPTSYGAIEMPVLDAFFPSPLVGYSKVTVKAIRKSNYDTTLYKTRSGIGKQVTEFYTAKDFPVYYNYTALDPLAEKSVHNLSVNAFVYKYAFDSRALTQGFLVATNDMHGKLKSQSSYAEGDEETRINYTENFYRNTGKNGLNETFDFIHASKSGEIIAGNMGVDIELMTDTREFSVKGNSLEIQAQLDLFPVFLPFWFPFIWPVVGNSENVYRAVTTTKVISYHSILDSVIVIDKGSMVSTKNIIYDSETGAVVVNRTNNSFDDPIYSVNYLAHWGYTGMGPAYRNIGTMLKEVVFQNGRLYDKNRILIDPKLYFESGDELLLTNVKDQLDPNAPSNNPCLTGYYVFLNNTVESRKIWAVNFVKGQENDLGIFFIDKDGNAYSGAADKLTIIRSGHRNMLSVSNGNITCLANPVRLVGGKNKLVIDASSEVINATAASFKDNWKTDSILYKKDTVVVPQWPAVEKTANGLQPVDRFGILHQNRYGYTVTGSTLDRFLTYTVDNGNNSLDSYRQTWIKFNLSSIPNKAVVKTAFLKLYNDDPTGHPHRNERGNSNMAVLARTKGKWIKDYTITTYILDSYFRKINEGAVDMFTQAYIPATTPNQYVFRNDTVNVKSMVQGMLNDYYNPAINAAPAMVIDIVEDGGIQGNDRANQISYVVVNGSSGTYHNIAPTLDITYFDPCTPGVAPSWSATPVPGYYCYGSPKDSFLCKPHIIPTKTNPYRWGIWGSWRLNKSYVYYADRTVKDNLLDVNTRKDGVINGFISYWKFTDSTLVASTDTVRWVWNMQPTLFNNKGNEIETRDPLNRYTAAQYGYGKSLPVAITQNSKLREAMFEGFEDYDYTPLPQNCICCPEQRFIDLTKGGGQIVSTQSHTGLYSFKIAGNQTVTTNIPVTNGVKDGDVKVYANADSSIHIDTIVRGKGTGLNCTYWRGSQRYDGVDTTIHLNWGGLSPKPGVFGEGFSAVWEGSIQPRFTDDYTFYTNADDLIIVYITVNGIKETIQDIRTPNTNCFDREDCDNIASKRPIRLIAGKLYTIRVEYWQDVGPSRVKLAWKSKLQPYEVVPKSQLYIKSITQSHPDVVSSISYVNTLCVNPRPINSTNIFNDKFNPTQNSTIAVSAWVKQETGMLPTDDVKAALQLNFNTGTPAQVTLTPKGPVIEGWQRIEEVVTIPANCTEMAMQLKSTSGSAVFFDDIRVHGFNSNMKSYIYNPVNLRLVAELNENNYASFYEYDEEGGLIRVKAETKEGIKTIKETRSFQQRTITDF